MSLLADWMKSRLSGDPRSVREVAEEMGVSHTTVAKWLRGSRPSWEHCALIATFFDVQVDSIRRMAGYTEARTGTAVGAATLSPEEDALVQALRATDDEGRRLLLATARVVLRTAGETGGANQQEPPHRRGGQRRQAG